MSEYRSAIASTPPSASICDFDLVTHRGRQLFVGTANQNHQVCSWDPLTDEWNAHRLANAALEEGTDFSAIVSLGATVLDGRVVVGGGSEHQGFSTWELETGHVRLYEQADVVSSIATADFGDRAMFVVGSADGFGVTVWEPAATEADEDESGWEAPPVEDFGIDVDGPVSRSHASSGVAAGLSDGRRVLVGANEHGRVLVTDIDTGGTMTCFGAPPGEDPDLVPTEFALTTVRGATRVVAAGGARLLLGDPASGTWVESYEVPSGDVCCLDARQPNDRTFAVTGGEDGTICVWDLAEQRMFLQPQREHGTTVYGVRIAELDGQPVLISSGHDCVVRVWELPF